MTDEIIEIYPMGSQPKTKAGKEAYQANWRRASAAEKAAVTASAKGEKIMGLFSSKDTMRSPSAGRVRSRKICHLYI